jgi:hypothetical protein
MEIVMKRITLYLCVAVFIALALGCAKSKSFLETHDYNGDGQVTKEEYNRTFDAMDTNGNGVLDSGEAGSVLEGH